MSLAFDEYGRPYIVLKEQDSRRRIKGVDAIKVIILLSRETSLPQNLLLLLLDLHWVQRVLINCLSPETNRSLSLMMALPSYKKWKSNTQSPS